MMKLVIVRHGLAEDRETFQRTGAVSDDTRPLTEKGVRKMRKSARGLRELVARPTIVISSPLLRARQTADVLSSEWGGLRLEECELLRPEARGDEFFEKLLGVVLEFAKGEGAVARQPVVVVVGHEPHLSEFIFWMLAGSALKSKEQSERSLSHVQPIQLKKGGACLIEVIGGEFKADRLGSHANYQLNWLMPPSVLRALVR